MKDILTVPVGTFEVNCLVVPGVDDTAIVIDPGDDADRILAACRKQSLTIAAYVLTHGHMDHISALADLHSSAPAPIHLHPADIEWAFEDSNQMLPFYSTPRRPDAPIEPLCVASGLTLCGRTFEIIETPGHTPGSVCLIDRDASVLITGDTLFAGSVGRTDLHGGNSGQLMASLRQLKDLPPELTVYPGHGPTSTLAREFKTNPFLR